MSETKRWLIKLISRYLDGFELHGNGICLPTEHLKSASLDNVRASKACEACEPWLRVMRAKMASQHASHTVIES